MRTVILPRQNLMALDASSHRRERPVMVAEEDAAVGTLDTLVLPPQPLSQMQPVMISGLLRLGRFTCLMPERILRHGNRDLSNVSVRRREETVKSS